MAEQKRQRAVVHTTPKGVAVFPWITRPDTRFNKDGVYQTGLRLTEEDAAPVLALISAEHEKNLADVKAKNKGKKIKESDLPIQPELDEEGNETGNYIFKAKLNAQFENEGKVIHTAPALFDAKGKPIELDSLWGGSIIRIAYSIHPFYTATVGAGVSLRLRGVKVIKLAAGGGANADSMGFGEEEDGYDGEDSGFGSEDNDSSDGSSSGDQEEF